MVSSSINQCCSGCTRANRDLAQSQAFHAVEEDRQDRRDRLALLGLAGFVVVFWTACAVGGWWVGGWGLS